jgi:predicted dienelactone hydrolase
LTKKGDEAEAAGDFTLSSAFFLRAACIYRISRFPYITSFPEVNSGTKWKAWKSQKEVYLKAATKWVEPVKEVMVHHTAAKGADRGTIPVYVRIPKEAAETGQKAPVVLLMTGLDGYRPDNTERSHEFLARGWGVVIAEIPGTADCPSDPSDPESPDRLWTSILDWMESEGSFDRNRVMVWGLSSGGYCAVRIAHTQYVFLSIKVYR